MTIIAVRARPISDQQKSKGEKSCLSFSEGKISASGPSGANSSFALPSDFCQSTQEELWDKFGAKALEQVIAGFNVNTVLYGAKGTGHKYAAFGAQPFPVSSKSGLLPRACQALFDKIDENFKVEVGMFSLSKNSIRDMLSVNSSDDLQVTSGDPERVPDIENLTQLAVSSYKELVRVIQAAITRSASDFNGQPPGTTSRRQFVVQLQLTKVMGDKQTPSVWNLLVLSAASTQVGNKSLAEFKELVSGLASGKKVKPTTNLCKYVDNSIGGNAKTYMLASISQLQTEFSQTIDTLQFAERMNKVKDSAAVKEFPTDTGKWAAWASRTQETKSRITQLFGDQDRAQHDNSKPHLENVHDDKLLTKQLKYFLDSGETRFGRPDASVKQDVILSGLGILSSHCIIQNASGRLSIQACSGAKVIHNGSTISSGKPVELTHNDRLRLGSYATFRVVIPTQAGAKGIIADAKVNYAYVEQEINEKAAAEMKANTKGMSSEVEERIQQMLPLINEANSISEELRKGVSFELKVFAKHQIEGKKKRKKRSAQMDMNVQLTFTDKDREDILWDCDTFTDRLYEMRDMCNSFIENNGDMVFLQKNYSGSNDPFFIKGNEQMIGRSLIYLDPINHLLPIESKTPIIDYNGFSRGMLEMSLKPTLPKLTKEEMEARFDELESVEKLIGKQMILTLSIKGVKGIPSTLAKDVNVKYRFFMDETYSNTPKSKTKTINPKFNHKQTWNLVVDDELCQYLASDVLELEVYGSSDTVQTPNAGPETKESTGKAESDAKVQNMIANMDQESAATAAALAELGAKQEEIEELKFQLQETRMDMQQKLRAHETKMAAQSGKEEVFKAKLEAKDELTKRVKFAEAKLEKAEKERDDLNQKLNAAKDELRKAEMRNQENTMRMQQQDQIIDQLREELDTAGKGKGGCTIL